jgi:chromosomal replication initiation ATPase DnaA
VSDEPPQIPLELGIEPARGRSEFFVSEANEAALAALDDWPRWPGGKHVLIGPEGSGKTHLAHIWADAAGARVVAAAELTEGDVPRLSDHGRVAVEDVPGLPAPAERALLHLHNLLAARHGSLLMTGRGAPPLWAIALPDLASRVQAAGVATLRPPDDALLAALLVKLFADRQMKAPPALVNWLLPRMERSFAAAQRIVARLDALTLAEAA